MQLETMTYQKDGRVARITLDRPARGNGITLNMPRELSYCVEQADIDSEVHVIALSGNGSGFCGGYDLVASAEHKTEESATADLFAVYSKQIRLEVILYLVLDIGWYGGNGLQSCYRITTRIIFDCDNTFL